MKHLRNFKSLYDAFCVMVDVPCVVSIDNEKKVLIIDEDDEYIDNGKSKIIPALIGAYRGNNTDEGESDIITDDSSYFLKTGEHFYVRYYKHTCEVHDCYNIEDYIEYLISDIKDDNISGSDTKYYYSDDDEDYYYTFSDAVNEKINSLETDYLEGTDASGSGTTVYKTKDGKWVTDSAAAAETFIITKYKYYRGEELGYDYYSEEELTEILKTDVYLWLFDYHNEPQVTTQEEI